MRWNHRRQPLPAAQKKPAPAGAGWSRFGLGCAVGEQHGQLTRRFANGSRTFSLLRGIYERLGINRAGPVTKSSVAGHVFKRGGVVPLGPLSGPPSGSFRPAASKKDASGRRWHPDNRQRNHNHHPDNDDRGDGPGSYFKFLFGAVGTHLMSPLAASFRLLQTASAHRFRKSIQEQLPLMR